MKNHCLQLSIQLFKKRLARNYFFFLLQGLNLANVIYFFGDFSSKMRKKVMTAQEI